MRKTLEQWLTWQETLHLSEIDLGLKRIGQVAKKLNLLHPTFPIITVAGTNGKGSCVAMLDAILSAEGYTTGSYTSPHLLEYNERIKLKGVNSSDQEIINAFEQIDKVRDNISLTYFEFSTLAAMLIFSKSKVDVAILEVGLGGRLDAANLWDASLALITSISIDHVDWLGDDRDQIAIEKSGIMRKNMPVISGEIDPPKTISGEAKRICATLYQVNQDYSVSIQDNNSWLWKNDEVSLSLPIPSLAGDFQINNAATVVAGLQAIKALLKISFSSIEQGLSTVSVLGRLQILSSSPTWLLDVAHNPDSAKQLANYLQANPVAGNTRALFSMLTDKNIEQVVALFDDTIDEWHIISLDGSRGLSTVELKQRMLQLSFKGKIVSYDDISDAYYSLKNITKSEDRVVAFGSFLVVSSLLNIWKPLHEK
ncbi:MAG: bifunctional tetrahydrofolate synthase/dihydrofolate synthase [Cocleimonas sp.]